MHEKLVQAFVDKPVEGLTILALARTDDALWGRLRDQGRIKLQRLSRQYALASVIDCGGIACSLERKTVQSRKTRRKRPHRSAKPLVGRETRISQRELKSFIMFNRSFILGQRHMPNVRSECAHDPPKPIHRQRGKMLAFGRIVGPEQMKMAMFVGKGRARMRVIEITIAGVAVPNPAIRIILPLKEIAHSQQNLLNGIGPGLPHDAFKTQRRRQRFSPRVELN